MTQATASISSGTDFGAAIGQSFARLGWKYQARNPVMFVVFVGAIITTLVMGYVAFVPGSESPWFIGGVAFWLWFTVILEPPHLRKAYDEMVQNLHSTVRVRK